MSEATAQNVDERAPLLENAASEPSYNGAQPEDDAVAKPSKGRIAAAKVVRVISPHEVSSEIVAESGYGLVVC